jgi:putative tryptophan/tyrosine transport system substrate-binding protein
MQFGQLRRRGFITLLGGAAAWSTRAAASGAGDRVPQSHHTRSLGRADARIASRSQRCSVQSDEDIRTAIDTLATMSGSGVIVPSDSFTFERAAMIASLATNNRLPGVYAFARFARQGGLISYGIDLVEQLGKAAE